jgi:hypothetical protein
MNSQALHLLLIAASLLWFVTKYIYRARKWTQLWRVVGGVSDMYDF